MRETDPPKPRTPVFRASLLTPPPPPPLLSPTQKVIRGDDGEVRTYPVVETVQLDNVCHTTLTPARVSSGSAAQAVEAARRAVESLWGAGVFGVELFLMKDGSVLLNEIAPR